MNKISDSIFKHRKPDFEKLQDYGFERSGENYLYRTTIMGGKLALNIAIGDSDVDTEVIDLATGEPYTLFLADGACGSFVGAVRTAYENVMRDIAEKCFYKCVFKSEYAQKLIRHVKSTYGGELEFLWEKFPDYAVWRRSDNRKWYGIILTVPKKKIGLPSDDNVEIMDLRADPQTIAAVVDNKTFFGGYHMNKKHWITVCLDGSVPLEEIKRMLGVSYDLAH